MFSTKSIFTICMKMAHLLLFTVVVLYCLFIILVLFELSFIQNVFLKQRLKPSPIIEIAPGRNIGGNFPCFIIAEIGQNHQGDIEIAKKLIQIAVVSYLLFINTLKYCFF